MKPQETPGKAIGHPKDNRRKANDGERKHMKKSTEGEPIEKQRKPPENHGKATGNHRKTKGEKANQQTSKRTPKGIQRETEG